MNRHKLDATDLRILAEVQRDGRITKVALAERVGLSATPCWNRLRRLEAAGIITGYHARLSTRSVLPIIARTTSITWSPESTSATSGPLVMNVFSGG